MQEIYILLWHVWMASKARQKGEIRFLFQYPYLIKNACLWVMKFFGFYSNKHSQWTQFTLHCLFVSLSIHCVGASDHILHIWNALAHALTFTHMAWHGMAWNPNEPLCNSSTSNRIHCTHRTRDWKAVEILKRTGLNFAWKWWKWANTVAKANTELCAQLWQTNEALVWQQYPNKTNTHR